MKRKNYYQVHKNKKPKRIKLKKGYHSVRNLKIFFKVVDKFSPFLNKICANISKEFNIQMISINKLSSSGPTERVVISIDSSGGTI